MQHTVQVTSDFGEPGSSYEPEPMMTLVEAMARIAELEEALKNAVWFSESEILHLQGRYGLTPSEARAVMVLYRARGPLGRIALDGMIPSEFPAANRKEKEFRTLNTITVWINHIRKKMGANVIQGTGWTGYRITEIGKVMVERAL